jgi:multiple sugar transport system permease protein
MEPAQEAARLRPARFVSYDARAAAAMLLPIVLVLSLVVVFPILYSLYTSFFGLKLTRPHRVPFVGFDNYIEVIRSDLFWVSVVRTATFSVMSVTAITVLALLAALLLNETFRGRRVLAAMLLVPWSIPTVANGLMWKWIYDESFGALNGALMQLGLIDRYLVWLGDPAKTLALVANAYVWRAVPLATILLLVTMKSIPDVLYGAAKVDGAGLVPRFLHVTLPSLTPGLVMVVIFETMLAIRHFDLFFILTSGGPGDASHVAAWHVYVETFRNLSFGTGSALAYMMALATFAIAWVVIRMLGRRV